jgi:hypothetical protein
MRLAIFSVSLLVTKYYRMKLYTLEQAHFLVAYYSNVERIDCQFEVVRDKAAMDSDDAHVANVGILCVDRTATPPMINDLDDVVKGLKLTPTKKVLDELEK